MTVLRTRGTRLRLDLLVAAALLTGCPASGWADEPAPAADAADSQPAADGPPGWAYSLAHDLMSPFCPGRTLAACPSPQAEELRQWILFQAVAGRSRDDIEKSLYDRYGDEILAAPRATGWGLSAYAVPILAFLIGGGGVVWVLRRLVLAPAAVVSASRPAREAVAAASPVRPPPHDAELERLVDEELSRL